MLRHVGVGRGRQMGTSGPLQWLIQFRNKLLVELFQHLASESAYSAQHFRPVMVNSL